MRLTQSALSLSLAEPFVSSKGATTSIEHVKIEIAWRGHVGLGVAVPAKDYGMTLDGVRAALDEHARVVADRSPTEIARVLRDCADAAPKQTSALAAVDMAIHDLLGQVAGLPLRSALGLDGLPLSPTAVSLGVMSIEKSVERARALAEWPILKLKMSAPDLELVRRVHEVHRGRIWIDGNGAWSATDAVRAAEDFARHGVELLEQPVPPGHLEDLRFVRDRAPMLVLADEDCTGPEDVLRLARCAHGVNVKLLKCGGIRRALETITLARQAGLKVMLGCKTESALGITAVAQLGALADFLDVDGHLDVVDDPFEGIVIDRGRITLPSGPGLGVRARAVRA